MKVKFLLFSLLFGLLFTTVVRAQIIDEEQKVREKQSALPKAIDFGQLMNKGKMTPEEFTAWKRQRAARLQERLLRVEALEGAVDPNLYLVGPGDVFSFNLWNLDEHIYLPVTPSGHLLVPSAGAINVSGLSLADAVQKVYDTARPFYDNADFNITLEALRTFRVHVVGEVNFPGTHVAQAVERVSELITLSGGPTERAWKGGIEIRHSDGTKDFFDLSAFEVDGQLDENIFITGGDVVFVPGVSMDDPRVKVESNQEFAGTYRINPGEDLYYFLRRIRALARNSDLSLIQIARQEGNVEKLFTPYRDTSVTHKSFALADRDRIFLPGLYVYVKGAVRTPGAFPYVFNATAREYAGMAGGDFRSGGIKEVRVYKSRTGEYEKGPDVLVEPGDVVHLHMTWNNRLENFLRILTSLASLVIAAKAVGLFGK